MDERPPPRTVLIIDDDPSVTEAFERILRLEGYHVITALNAESGLKHADEQRPGAIILDLRMPLVDGVQFLKRLRSRPEHARTPVAIVTGDYFIDERVTKEIDALHAEVRYKPLWLKELMALARYLVNRSPAASQPH